MALNLDAEGMTYDHPVYKLGMKIPGGAVAVGGIDALLNWGMRNSMWLFPMATSCCGIELMAAAAARVDLDRMGTIVRGTPRQADVMVVAGTITVKMAPRVRKLWDQMPEPKWCIAMGSCAISGDFYRNLYAVVPGIDTVLPVDLYIPGCPPNPEALMQGLKRLQEKVKARREGLPYTRDEVPPPPSNLIPLKTRRVGDPTRDPMISIQQERAAARPGDAAGETLPQPPMVPMPLAANGARPFAEVLTQVGAAGPDPLVGVEHVEALAAAARADGYSLLSYLVATHYPAPAPKDGAPKAEDEVEVAYGFRRPSKGAAMASFRTRVKLPGPIPSIASSYAGADWQEREQSELLGVTFENHPDARRLLLPQDFVGHPLRRDFAADAPCAPWR